MSDEELPDEVIEAALGLTNKKPQVQLYGAWLWIGEDDGPHDGVQWHRYVTRRVWAAGGDLKAGAAVYRELRRELQTGLLRTFGVSADGARVDLPASIWRGFGQATENLWSLGVYKGPSDPACEYRVFVPSGLDWWPRAEQDLTSWCALDPRADTVARERLKTRKGSRSDAAICRELCSMWSEAGRKETSWKVIQTLRRRARGR